MTSMTFTHWCFLSIVCAPGCWINCLLLSIVLIFSGLPTVAQCSIPRWHFLPLARCCSGGRQVHQNTQLTFWKAMKKKEFKYKNKATTEESKSNKKQLTFPTNCLFPSLYSQSGNQGNNSERCYIVGHIALWRHHNFWLTRLKTSLASWRRWLFWIHPCLTAICFFNEYLWVALCSHWSQLYRIPSCFASICLFK